MKLPMPQKPRSHHRSGMLIHAEWFYCGLFQRRSHADRSIRIESIVSASSPSQTTLRRVGSFHSSCFGQERWDGCSTWHRSSLCFYISSDKRPSMRIMPDSAKSSLVHLRKSSHPLKKQIWCFLVSFCNGCIVQSPLPICGVRVLSDGFRVKQLATTCLEYSTLSYSFYHSKLVLNSSFLLIPTKMRGIQLSVTTYSFNSSDTKSMIYHA